MPRRICRSNSDQGCGRRVTRIAAHAQAVCRHRRSGCRGADARYDGQHGSGQEIRGGWRSSSSYQLIDAAGIVHPQAYWQQREVPAPSPLSFGASTVSSGRGPGPCDPSGDVRVLTNATGNRIDLPSIPAMVCQCLLLLPDASFPVSPQSDFDRRFGSWPSPSGGGVLAGVNQASQGQPDTPNNEDWSAMWRRRTGLP